MKKNRIKKCLKLIEKTGLDALLLSSPSNIRYLSGFRQAEGYLLLNPYENIYFTNFIYAEEAEEISLWKTKLVKENLFEAVAKGAKNLGIKKLGFEAKHLTFLEYKLLKKCVTNRNINFVKTTDLVADLRSIKDEKEIKFIKEATKITLQGFEFVEELIDSGLSEKQISLELEKFLKLKGDNKVAFPPIVAFGRNSSVPHHLPCGQRLGRDRISLIDSGAMSSGYCSDLTRIFFSGKIPIHMKKIYDLIKKAQSLAIKKIKPGLEAKELDRAARDLIEKNKMGKYFGHGLGHGIGISVHEKPFLNPYNREVLKENMVLTIEPAVYLPGKFGIRLESIVIIRKNGAEVIDGDSYR